MVKKISFILLVLAVLFSLGAHAESLNKNFPNEHEDVSETEKCLAIEAYERRLWRDLSKPSTEAICAKCLLQKLDLAYKLDKALKKLRCK